MRRVSWKITFSKRLLALVLILAIVYILVFMMPFSRKAIFCSEFFNPYEVTANYNVFVSTDKHTEYVERLKKFLNEEELDINSGEQSISEVGRPSYIYRNYNTTGCDGASFLWSSNVARQNEFIVTIYHNILVNKKKANRLKERFFEEFHRNYAITNVDKNENK